MGKRARIILGLTGIFISLVIIIGTIYYCKQTLTTKESVSYNVTTEQIFMGLPDTVGGATNKVNNEYQVPSSNSSSTQKVEEPTNVETTTISSKATLSIVHIIILALGSLLFAVSLLSLTMSDFGNHPIFIDNKLIPFISYTILITIFLTMILVYITNVYIL